MALNPTLQGGITPESPVQQTSSLETTANLASLFAQGFSGITRSTVSASDQKKQYEAGLNDALVKGLGRAQDLRSQGKRREADRMERVVKTNFAREGGDLGSADTKALITSFTGREAEDVGFSAEEVAFRKTIESPDFQNVYLGTFGTNPDLNEEERINLAFDRMQKKEANEAILISTTTDWNASQGQSSRIAVIDEFWQTRKGVLTLSGKDGVKVSNDLVQQTQLEFNALEAQIAASHPGAGVPEGDWKPIQDYLDITRKQLEIASSLTSNDELAADQLRIILDGVSSLSPEQATKAEKNLVILTLMDNRQNFVESGLLAQGRFLEILNAAAPIDSVKTPDRTEAGLGTSNDQATESFSTEEMSGVKDVNPAQNFKDAKNLSDAMGGVGNVVTDPRSLSKWVGFSSQGLANLYSMAADNESWATAEGYRSFFSDNFFNTMGELNRTGNTTTYTSIRNKAMEAIEANQVALRASVASRIDGTPIEYDRVNNRIFMNWETVTQGNNGLTPEAAASLRTAIDATYGGDLQAAIKDRGKKLRPQVSGFGAQKFDPATKAATEAYQALQLVTRPFGDEDITQQLQGINQLERFKSRLPAVELKGASGDTELSGGAGEDTLSGATENFTGSAPDLIKGFEGFRNTAYWDVDAWRTGYGSDTITKADGSIVKVTEDTVVSREDAERDLARRTQEFADTAKRQVGSSIWTSLPSNVTDALTSIAYNYGSLPDRIVPAVKSGDINAIANAVEDLGSDNDGVNRRRRTREAAIIRGAPNTTRSAAAPVYSSRPEARPLEMDTETETTTTQVSNSSGTPQATGGSTTAPTATEAQVGEATPRRVVEGVPRASEQEIEKLSSNTKEMLKKLEVSVDDMPAFNSQQELSEAVDKGVVSDGEIVLVEGKVQMV